MSTPTLSYEQLEAAAERVAAWPHQSSLGILVPYAPDNKTWFPENFLVELYSLLVRDNLLATVFPEGAMDLNQFIVYCHAKPIQILLAKRESMKWPLAGFGWLYDIGGVDGARRAKCGFTFFKEFWHGQTVRQLSWLLLNWWITELKIDVIYGTCLTTNRLAINYAKKFGFEEVGKLPGFFASRGRLNDAVLVVLEKEKYAAAKAREEARRG